MLRQALRSLNNIEWDEDELLMHAAGGGRVAGQGNGLAMEAEMEA